MVMCSVAYGVGIPVLTSDDSGNEAGSSSEEFIAYDNDVQLFTQAESN